ncbi:MAG TPA: NUDIX hydrolase [Thermoleophilaceae bacterium]|nr:NUDIX hydrolase [Thermoleophilaceae bacterium]
MTFRFCPLCGERLAPKPSGPDAGRPACPTGHFVHYDNPPATVQAWIERDRRYLILKRNEEPFAGEWDLPGGFVEMGESPADAAIREVAEETGLVVAVTGLIGAFTSPYGDTGRHTVDIAYRCRIEGGEFQLDREEKSDAAWFGLDEMPRLAFAGEREALAALREGTRES